MYQRRPAALPGILSWRRNTLRGSAPAWSHGSQTYRHKGHEASRTLMWQVRSNKRGTYVRFAAMFSLGMPLSTVLCPWSLMLPRPSGLRTHMRSHNNIKRVYPVNCVLNFVWLIRTLKAYPCTFPGCLKMFGVRSNAKRHLGTHYTNTENDTGYGRIQSKKLYNASFSPYM